MRIRNRYEKGKPFKLSRSAVESFTRCPKCFYLDRRLGIPQPPGYPFNLNSAVDYLLKKEFDYHRARKEPHPLMVEEGIDAIPFDHPELDAWRENFRGVQYHHTPTNLTITGAVDDLWQHPTGEVAVVDYKATSKDGEVTLDAEWQDGYKRQMEFYQWLLRRKGLPVSDIGYFVYCNGLRNRSRFDKRLEFDIKVIPYRGSDAWVDDAITRAHATLAADTVPLPHPACEFCRYRAEAARHE